MKREMLFITTVILTLFITACAANGAQTATPPAQPPESPTQTAPPLPTVPKELPGRGLENEQQQSIVEGMEILILESFPVQVHVLVNGYLPDGCTSIRKTEAERVDDTTYAIQIFTTRNSAAMCTMALAPFQETVPLDVKDLPAGTYTVQVADLVDTFTLDIDNSSSPYREN